MLNQSKPFVSTLQVWIKKTKNASYEPSQVPRTTQYWELAQLCDSSSLLLHKRKNGSAQRILYHILGLYRYTIHKRPREMGLDAGFFKKKHMN